jgi:hypothetical protein
MEKLLEFTIIVRKSRERHFACNSCGNVRISFVNQLCLGKYSELDTFIWTFFLTMTDTVTSKNIDSSFRIALYTNTRWSI